MTFERRRSPFLPFLAFAPDRHKDITPSQVRCYVTEHRWVKVVRLSGALLKRDKAVQDEWRKLDYDLCEAGIDVYFTFGGTGACEAKFSDGKAPGQARRPYVPPLAAAAPLAGVTPIPKCSNVQDMTPVTVLHPDDGDLSNVLIQSDGQLVMLLPDDSELINITDPNVESVAPVPVCPEDGVTAASSKFVAPEGVLHKESASPMALEPAQVDDLIAEIADRPDSGGHRTIAATLFAEDGIKVSHMKVKRVLDARK
ncbi:MAG: hypothetical protein O2913_09875 [Chloroflexi bacterium]|nr:hypothetical protein [Chloroflexota bacterium]